MADKKLSFIKGTQARAAASNLSEDIKASDRGSQVDNPHALSRYLVKRMSRGKRAAVAARR